MTRRQAHGQALRHPTPVRTFDGTHAADEHYLFDPAPFETGTPRQLGRTTSPDVVVTVSHPGWRVIARHRSTPSSVAHRIRVTNAYRSVVTECGEIGRTLHELELGTPARLCAACAATTPTQTEGRPA